MLSLETTPYRTRIVAEIVAFVAASVALSYVKVFSLPQGGSVTAGSMVPVIWLSLRRGAKVGLFSCVLYGVVQLVVEPFVYHPGQVLLDYPIAFGALGLSGFFMNYVLLGVAIGITGRFIAHFLSGIVFFAEYAPEGMSPIVYSAIYNGSYLTGELIVSSILTYIILKRSLLKIYLE